MLYLFLILWLNQSEKIWLIKFILWLLFIAMVLLFNIVLNYTLSRILWKKIKKLLIIWEMLFLRCEWNRLLARLNSVKFSELNSEINWVLSIKTKIKQRWQSKILRILSKSVGLAFFSLNLSAEECAINLMRVDQ